MLREQSEAALQDFINSNTAPCKAFEERLAARKFLQTSSKGSVGPLTSLLQDAQDIFRRKLRDQCLVRARDILLQEYHNTMPVHF
jgi:hypothetical protein